MPRFLLLSLLVAASIGLPSCAYPRRSTSLSEVHTSAGGVGEPSNVYWMTIVSAQVNERNRGNSDWDQGGGAPDPFVRVYRDDQLVFESRTIDDTITPEWNQALTSNIEIPPDAAFRLEVWDRDAIGADPIGIYRGHGRPGNALPGVDARVILEGESYLTIHLDEPHAYRGIGISGFEVRGSELAIVSVEPHSPAGRAGLHAGDRITAIGGRTISELGAQQATSALNMAAERHQDLAVISAGQSQPHDVELDHGYVWLTM
jgi:hypothetical protein